MFYSDNPVSDFERHDAEQERKLERLPICSECGERIQSDTLYLINDETICPECLEANYRKCTDDFME